MSGLGKEVEEGDEAQEGESLRWRRKGEEAEERGRRKSKMEEEDFEPLYASWGHCVLDVWDGLSQLSPRDRLLPLGLRHVLHV